MPTDYPTRLLKTSHRFGIIRLKPGQKVRQINTTTVCSIHALLLLKILNREKTMRE